MKKMIDVKSEDWAGFLDEIQRTFECGELISHEYLKHKFTLEELKFEDYNDSEEFIAVYQNQQFAYMSLIDILRWQLLKENSLFLKNVRGDGYTLLPAKEQVQFGYDEFMDTIKVSIKRADLIMNYVRSVPAEQQSKDNDLRAKCSMLKQMLKSIK